MSQHEKRNYDAPFNEIQDVFNKLILPIIQHPNRKNQSNALIAEQIGFVANMVANWELRGIGLFCQQAICWAVDNPEKQNLFFAGIQYSYDVMLRTRVYGVPNGKGNPPEKIYKIDHKFYKLKAIRKRGFNANCFGFVRPQNDSGYCDSRKYYYDNKSLIGDTCDPIESAWEIQLSDPYLDRRASKNGIILMGLITQTASAKPQLSHKTPSLNWAHDITHARVRDVNMRKFYTDSLQVLMKCFAPKENTHDSDWARFGFCFTGTNANFFTNPFPELIEDDATPED